MTKNITNSLSKGLNKYESEKHVVLLSEILEQGMGIPSFCKYADISDKTFRNWLERHEEFNQAYEIGLQKQKAHYHERLADAMDSKEANLAAIMSAAKVIAGISGNKPLHLKGFKKDGDIKGHMQCLFNNISDGYLDKEEAKVFSEILSIAVRVEENSVIKEELKQVKAHLGLE